MMPSVTRFFIAICSSVLTYVNKSIEELEKRQHNNVTNREASVLEKLLKIDRHAAVVMTMDMLMAGVDTVGHNY